MSREPVGEFGPSWNDVRIAISELAKTHQKSVKVEIGQTSRASGPNQLYFRVVALGPVRDDFGRDEVGEGHPWPAGDWKTVPAMLLALIHRLDWKLTQDSRVAQR